QADVLLDLLTDRRDRTGPRGTVELTVGLETLAGLDEDAGDLNGYGPVLADIARQVADRQRTAEWRFRVVDGDGCLHDAGATRRRPTADQARWVEARDRRCVFPGCRMPARHADLDHIRPHAEHGPTCPCNLAALCRYHHTGRHRFGWTYRHSGGGVFEWTSPLGRAHVTSGRSP
ncbi:MAG: HNH endonuclease signature motif containing protein, partial [Acidimicrobiia bacterium]|nr:HNH endonuclease signature motif containing protein [Acidimicrobiia bacterium]